MEKGSYRAGEFDSETRDYEDAPGLPVKPTTLPKTLRFQDVETLLEGVVTRDRALTRFLPQGYATPTWVHLETEGGTPYTVVVHPILGRAEVVEGRLEPE